MRPLLRLLLVLCFAIALARAAAFLAYAVCQVDSPVEAYHLEAKSAHLAWRVQAGEALYPPWRGGDRHVTNFFGPLYFLAVGGAARLLDADLDGLIRIGRLVTVGSGLLAAVLVGVAAARREGRFAGAFAGLIALGAAPMIGFGAMVRPDAMADTLGFAGFLLAAGSGSPSPSRRRLGLGAALLVAAVFTKQTAALYPAAAVLAIAISGDWRRAAALAGGMAAASAAIVAAVTLAVEPRFAADLLGEAGTSSSIANARYILDRLQKLAPELLVLSAVAFGLWTVRRPRDLPLLLASTATLAGLAVARLLESTAGGVPSGGATAGGDGPGRGAEAAMVALSLAVPLGAAGLWAAIDPRRGRDLPLATLAAVQLIGSTAALLKLGSELNYFLGLRLVAALGAGAVWGAVRRFASGPTAEAPASKRSWARPLRGGALVVGLLAIGFVLLPGLLHDVAQLEGARRVRRYLDGPGRPVLAFQRQLFERAADPDASILSDSGAVQLRQRDRAPFVDPWLFRVMVMDGRIDPVAIRRRLEAREYELVVTAKDLFDVPVYDAYDFRLPPELAGAARRNYEPVGIAGGLYLYVPRDGRRREGWPRQIPTGHAPGVHE